MAAIDSAPAAEGAKKPQTKVCGFWEELVICCQRS